MRKIRIFEHISLDGVIQPDGDGDFANGGWTAPYRSPAGAAALAEAQGTSFDLLLGRRTYDLWADYCPKITSGPLARGLNAAGIGRRGCAGGLPSLAGPRQTLLFGQR